MLVQLASTIIPSASQGAAALHGFILALGLILPLGVQNVFIFQQGALQHSFRKALPAVLTAAVCDTLLIGLAVGGMSLAVLNNSWLETLLMAAGSVFLLYMGISLWRRQPNSASDEAAVYSGKRQIAFAASVSLLNPHAILDTIGVIGGASLQYAGADRLTFALSCIVVSWLWFAALALTGRLAGQWDHSGRLTRLLNKASALIVAAIGLGLLYTVITRLFTI
ncbi:MAG: lysE type translocator family protein [Paenibacillaceae bacterium]|nr:lysE type translocator family protein [Paenibacillaceae bacterium]